MRRYKFEMDGSYVFYFGDTLGEAIKEFIKHRPERLHQITKVAEEPLKDCEKP